MIGFSYKNTYSKIKNIVDINITPYAYFDYVYSIFEENVQSRNQNTDPVYAGINPFVVKIINDEIIDNNERYFEHFYSLIDFYSIKSIEISNENDSKIEESIYKLATLEYKHDYSFIPSYFEYFKRNNRTMYKHCKGILFWIISENMKINDFVYKNKDKYLSKKYLSHTWKNLDFEEIIEECCELAISIFCASSKTFINDYLQSKSNGDVLNRIEMINNEFFGISKEKESIVFSRINYYNHRRETLENIGNKFVRYDENGNIRFLTRERIRQIENLCSKKIFNKMSMDSLTLDYFYSLKSSNHYPYLSYEQFSSIKGDKEIENNIKYMFAFIEYSNHSRIKKYNEYQVIYDSKYVNIYELVEEASKNLGITVLKKEYETLEPMEKAIVNNSYKRTKNGTYVKKGVSLTTLVKEVIKNYFVDGYHASQLIENDDYNKMIDILSAIYGVDVSKETPRNIAAKIDKTDELVAVDRGIFKHISQCTKLSDELINDILIYINDNKPVISYKAVYEKFSNTFNRLNINNQYYVKGLIDPILNSVDEYNTQRDYISVGEKTSFREHFYKEINRTIDIFNIEFLRKKFPGVKDYVYDFAIYSSDNIVQFENRNYILFDNLNINSQIIEELKKEIDDLMNKQNVGYITSRKLYSRLKILNNDLLNKIPLISNQYRLFSVLQHIFKNDYYFKRPIIGKDKEEYLDKTSIIYSFLKSQDEFDYTTLKEYLERINIGGIYSYLDLIVDMSDDFVQVSADRMVNKNKFNINDMFINKLDNYLDYYIKSFGELDTRTYCGYEMLPCINWNWDKYLLVGIVRTYLFDKYEIETTNSFYNTTDYIIKEDK